MEHRRRGYLAFMLRLWYADGGTTTAGAANWRVSLESPLTGERYGFGSLAELFVFLTEEVIRCEVGEAPPAGFDTKF
jgi:hypothetical protein